MHISKRDTISLSKAWSIRAIAILLALIVDGIIIYAIVKMNPLKVYVSLASGAFGTSKRMWFTIRDCMILTCIAIGLAPAFKMRFWNVGAEGQMLVGGIATAFWMINFAGKMNIVMLFLCMAISAIVAGGIWGLIPGVLKITRGQNEMIISIMLNYVATLFMGVLYTSWIRDENIPQTPAVSKLVQLPRVISGMRFTWGFVLALVVGLVMYYVLFWTSGGFKLRAVGYNMTASRFNGIPVKRYILTSFIISGAIAGLGGGAELLGTQFRLINGFGAGYGFDGVAMALIGQLHPIATVIVALFFAALRVGSTTMQAATGVPTSVSDIIQALVIVFSVAGMALTKLPEFESWKSRLFSRKRKAGDK